MKGLVFNIQRFSTKDGPGIRTTVFMKGCNINCLWCHNPESIDGKRFLRFDRRRCINCGRCAGVCRFGSVRMINGIRNFDYKLCRACGECVPVCPAEALEMIGEYYTVDELYGIVIKDRDYYIESGGGITFSGGEPLLQTEFLQEMMKQLKSDGFHTAVDTALHVDRNRIDAILPWTDLMLLDIKGMDPAAHLRNTGVKPDRIHENAKWLSVQGVDIIVRMPLVGGVNDSAGEIRAAAEFIRNWPRLLGVELLSYHSLGVEKSSEYGYTDSQTKFEVPDPVSFAEAENILRSAGVAVL